VGGATNGDRPAPLSPRCFWLLAKLAELCPCRPVYPQGKARKIFGGNQRRRSAGEDFCGPQAPTKEGLEGPERARTIRRTAAKKRRRHPGPGGPELCDGAPWTQQPAAPADAHQLVEAQRKPGRALRACTSTPGNGQPTTTSPRLAAGGRRPAPGSAGWAVRRRRPPAQAGHDGGPPAVTGPERPATPGPIRGGRGAGRLRSVRPRGGTSRHC
jgi:hypothetical protein